MTRSKNTSVPAPCAIDGCDGLAKVRGYCRRHYHNLWANGDPRSPSEQKDLWLRQLVDTPTNDCVEWPWAVSPQGYGIHTHKGRQTTAHRVALIMLTGKDPLKMDAAHGPCHNRKCVNPHQCHGMTWKTRSQNNYDRRRDGTDQAGSKNPGAKLDEESVIAIHAMKISGRSVVEIAKQYKVSTTTVHLILERKRWTHLDLDKISGRPRGISAYQWTVAGVTYESCILAAEANKVSAATIVNWCLGPKRKGVRQIKDAKPGCERVNAP